MQRWSLPNGFYRQSVIHHSKKGKDREILISQYHLESWTWFPANYIIWKLRYFFFLQKFKLVRFWEGYRSFNGTVNDEDKNPCFQVRKSFRILRGDSICEVIVWLDKDQLCQHYQIETCPGKSTFKIVDKLGGLIAEVNLVLQLLNKYEHFTVSK